jgi:HlyD family secretion protein
MTLRSPRATYLIVILILTVAGGVTAGWYSGLDLFGRSTGNRALVLSGNIEAHESVLAFKAVQSRIVELPFDEGQWVESGTVLARLDDSDYRQQASVDEAALLVQERQYGAARENVDAARKTVQRGVADVAQKSLDYNRTQRLWQQRVTSTADRDLAETALTEARAALERDQAMQRVAEENLALAHANVRYAREKLKLTKILLGYTILRAPFSGVILVRQAELGEVMLPGAPVVTLADLDHVWLRAYVNETDLTRVRWGQTATVRTDAYPARTYRGRVSFISSKAEFTPKSVETHAERVTLVYRVKIDVDNPEHELKPGMPADAILDVQPSTADD